MREDKENREKQLITVNVWKDEYQEFKAYCKSMRTTPTAIINQLIREAPTQKKQQL